ncbi:MAG: hypothetical protein CMG18_00640 [Candidatus Marinimicrobia bacterium]|jgi:hypothetical protein|nr:hypothetical protein [Candidatus Neomarinimicrobiota bacterium]|tara:strand:+ start:477 stop:863 length:387 start_codon:yes stop_codon:yes gene_type:complete
MSEKKRFFKQYKFHLVLWLLIASGIILALQYGIDQKLVVFSTVILGIFTQVFAGLGALIAMVPIIGPFLVKIITIPFFWLINALGHGVSIVAIRKGYSKELVKSRVLTVAILVGIVIGYIMGNLIPLN